MRLTQLFRNFFDNLKGGILLIVCTIVSLLLANSSVADGYQALWHQGFAGLSVEQWINDGLMAIFFFLIGLELKRELLIGELSNRKNALLPGFAAVGGMIVPAVIYTLFNWGTITQAGAGIPMATDIAFAIGVLSLLGKRVPNSMKVFLTAIAVIDDLGAIIVIALFYTTDLSITYLLFALGIYLILWILNHFKVKILFLYLMGGVAMWYLMLHSGVHATISGVLLAFVIPFEKGKKTALSYQLENKLHWPVGFIVLPLFALANTAITFDTGWDTGLAAPGSLGIFAGLIIGKPLGVISFCAIATYLGIGLLPVGVNWKHLIGVGMLAGIGFTMSIFITLLAYNDAILISESKISILLASLISGTLGFVWLKNTLQPNAKFKIK